MFTLRLVYQTFISSPTSVDDSILAESGGREKKEKECLKETEKDEESVKCIAKESISRENSR